jgi:hypothetical protein
MTFNSQTIIQEARADFEKMLDFVKGKEARTATADHIERGLFKLLLALGAKLLTLFFVNGASSGIVALDPSGGSQHCRGCSECGQQFQI